MQHRPVSENSVDDGRLDQAGDIDVPVIVYDAFIGWLNRLLRPFEKLQVYI